MTHSKPQFTKTQTNVRELSTDSIWVEKTKLYKQQKLELILAAKTQSLYVKPWLTFPQAPQNNWVQKSKLRLVENSSDLGKQCCKVWKLLAESTVDMSGLYGISGWARHDHVIDDVLVCMMTEHLFYSFRFYHALLFVIKSSLILRNRHWWWLNQPIFIQQHFPNILKKNS